MVNKKGKIALEIMIMLITIVVTSAVVLVLVQVGAVNVKSASASSEPILNTQFVPMGEKGGITIKKFQFCTAVTGNGECIEQQGDFSFGQEIYFLSTVESSTYNGQIKLVKNYRIISPSGMTLLDNNAEDNFYFEGESNNPKEFVTFSDYFIISSGNEIGEYTLELIIRNPLLNKETKLIKKFNVGQGTYETYDVEFAEVAD